MSEDDHNDCERTWNERQAELERLLGPAEAMVLHALIPFNLGGQADVLEFRNYVNGHCFVTADLTGNTSQPANQLGNYELMICTREKEDWAPNLIARLAPHTFEMVLQPLETMDIGPALPKGSRATALLFLEPDLAENEFTVDGLTCGLLLCMTILPDELSECMSGRRKTVIDRLRQRGVFPFSDLHRDSVL